MASIINQGFDDCGSLEAILKVSTIYFQVTSVEHKLRDYNNNNNNNNNNNYYNTVIRNYGIVTVDVLSEYWTQYWTRDWYQPIGRDAQPIKLYEVSNTRPLPVESNYRCNKLYSVFNSYLI